MYPNRLPPDSPAPRDTRSLNDIMEEIRQRRGASQRREVAPPAPPAPTMQEAMADVMAVVTTGAAVVAMIDKMFPSAPAAPPCSGNCGGNSPRYQERGSEKKSGIGLVWGSRSKEWRIE